MTQPAPGTERAQPWRRAATQPGQPAWPPSAEGDRGRVLCRRAASIVGAMWESDARLFRAVRDAELALLATEVRGDRDRAAALLAPDFVEIGRSGRRWTRDEMVAALANEPARDAPPTRDWQFNELAPGLILVTYVIEGATRVSRHSSIWSIDGDTALLRFHQGTLVDA